MSAFTRPTACWLLTLLIGFLAACSSSESQDSPGDASVESDDSVAANGSNHGESESGDSSYAYDASFLVSAPSKRHTLEFQDLTLALIPPSERQIQLSLAIEFAGKDQWNRAKKAGTAVQELLIAFFHEKSPRDMIGCDAKIKIKDELVVAIDELLGDRAVKEVYFTNLLIL